MSERKDVVLYSPKSNLPVVVDDGGLHAYLEKIKQFPVLNEEEERKLIYQFKEQGDLKAA